MSYFRLVNVDIYQHSYNGQQYGHGHVILLATPRRKRLLKGLALSQDEFGSAPFPERGRNSNTPMPIFSR
jgi:hypothetical protein